MPARMPATLNQEAADKAAIATNILVPSQEARLQGLGPAARAGSEPIPPEKTQIDFSIFDPPCGRRLHDRML